ncbi:MAG TPA: carbohydrate-binding protein [Clostridium sp.]|nr:carbohydrate-binding protein [Clostridium sp.]
MKRGKPQKIIALVLVLGFIVSSFAVTSFAGETVKSYCTRASAPVMAVNLGGDEDITYGGTSFKKQSAHSNLKVEVKGPSDSVYPTGTVNALSIIQAEDYSENHGLVIEDCPDVGGTENLAYIANGDYTAYENVYFPKGTKGFIARVSSDTEGGYIELRIDSTSGEVVGRCLVENTGGWENYEEVYCELTKSIEGVHTLYMGFVGERDGLFNVNWFRFTKSPYEPIMAKNRDGVDGGAYQYKLIDFGEESIPTKFKVHLSSSINGTISVRLDSPTGTAIATVDGASGTGEVEGRVIQSVAGMHELYLTDDKNGTLISKVDWFVFEPVAESEDISDGNLLKLAKTSARGYNVNLVASLDKNNVYEVYIHPVEFREKNRQIFDLYINGTLVDTIDTEESGLNWEKKGPYITKVLDDGKLNIECKSRQGIVSLAGLEINKITYSKAFSDVKIKDWFYIPVMELASQGVIFGKGNDVFKPQDHIIGEHVAYMMFNVMKVSISEKDSKFSPEKYRNLSDVSPDYWAYPYMSAYYNYFFKEKMLRYDVNTRVPYSAKQYEESKKVRREEFAMAIIGARRLDYNEDGKVFVLDPYLEPSAMLNRYKEKDADKVTDSFRYFVELALEKGLMKGDQFGNLNPKNPVTRGEAAAFIYNALNLYENNFEKPNEGEKLPVPRITARKRNVNVGILVLPAPAWDSINNIAVNDSNPDFTIMELLNRNINKPMDWVLVNPHPPAFNKSEYKDIMHLNSSKVPGINNSSYSDFSSYFKDLKSVAEAQTDLEADITYLGTVGYTENINKSKFFKYWEVSLDDPNLTPEKIAKDYDILFQTSHGEITYSKDVQDKVKAFLNAGGQLWWENCRGLEIESGDGFTEEVEFVSLNPGHNRKYPQIPVLDSKGKMHALFDNIYRINPDKTSRVFAPGIYNKNSEISMLGDGEEWLNDDNRYLAGLQSDDIVILNIENTDTGEILPNLAVRNIENDDAPAGRIVISTSDIGCGISKFVDRGGGKAVEDYKFCYNLFGWMSKIDVSFDETTVNQWDGGSEFSVEATFTNNGAKTQVYDVTYEYDPKLWNLAPTSDFKNYKEAHSWIKAVDENGYPKKIQLEPNQTEVVTYKFNIKKSDLRCYDFTVKASESGVKYTRDMVETLYRLNNVRVEKPIFSGRQNNGGEASFDVTINAPEEPDNDLRTEDYELNIKIKKDGGFIDPETVVNSIQLKTDGNTPPLEGYNYKYLVDNKGVLYLKVIIEDTVITKPSEKIRLNISLKNLDGGSYETVGKIEVIDPISRQRLAFSDETVYKVK